MVPDHPNRWSIVLAGGNGERTRSMIQQWLGYAKPKQFCSFVGKRSLLQHTWDRADQITPPDRKVTVMARSHHPPGWPQIEQHPQGYILLQPRNCDTAPGIFLPATYVRAWNSDATVIVYPSDHFVFPERLFVEIARRVVHAAELWPERIILMGVTPTDAEQEYGWVQPGETIGWSSSSRVQTVKSFLEKPDPDEAREAMASGALWNTFVFAANIQTLWRLGWEHLPEIMGFFEELTPAIGTPREGMILEAMYRHMPVRNFSTGLLQRVQEKLGLIELRDVIWSDWGHPERIAATLRSLGLVPNFPMSIVEVPSRARAASSREKEKVPC